MDVPSEMVERVARALHDAQFEDKEQAALEWNTWRESAPYARKLARYAIEAMMEPSATVLDFGCAKIRSSTGEYLKDADVRDAWQAMLRGALSPSLKEQERTP